MVSVPTKKAGEWAQEFMVINHGKTLYLDNYVYETKNISKLRIKLEPTNGMPFKIKFDYLDRKLAITSASKESERIESLPSHYYLFAAIFHEKLIALGTVLAEQ